MRSVVSVVLFAVFFEFLLPNHQLQKYVRIVTSFFILFILISPLLTIIKQNDDVENWVQHIENKSPNVEKKFALSDIYQTGEQIRSMQHEAITENVERQLATQIKSELQAKFAIAISDINVKTKKNTQNHAILSHIRLNITQVNDIWQGSDSNLVESEASAMSLFTPIDPIDSIYLDSSEIDFSFDEQSNQTQLMTDSQTYRAIKEYLADKWSVPIEQISIREKIEHALK